MHTSPPTPIRHSIVISTSAQRLSRAYEEAEHWHRWDHATKKAYFHEAVRVGTTGKLTPSKGLSVKMLVTDFVPERELTVECPVLGSRMRFEHHIEVIDALNVRAIHTVKFSGWLASWFNKTVGKDVQEGLPKSLEGLKRYLESDEISS